MEMVWCCEGCGAKSHGSMFRDCYVAHLAGVPASPWNGSVIPPQQANR